MPINRQIWFALTQIATHDAMGFFEFEIYHGMTCLQGSIVRPYRVRPYRYGYDT